MKLRDVWGSLSSGCGCHLAPEPLTITSEYIKKNVLLTKFAGTSFLYAKVELWTGLKLEAEPQPGTQPERDL